MILLRISAIVIGISQIALGVLYFAAPAWFIAWQGLTPIAPDHAYPLAMLAARFLVYGLGMFLIAHDPVRHAAWLFGMVAIQALDLAAGVGFVATGIVPLADAAVPMVNATLFIVALTGFGLAALRSERGFARGGHAA